MEKTLGRKVLIVAVSVIFISAFASAAGAIPLTWTDGNITYSLEITDTNTAEFTIAVDSASDWRVGWVAFKFSPGGGAVTDVISGPGSWDAGSDGTMLPWGGNNNDQYIHPFDNSWAGFYWIGEPELPELGSGLPLDAGTYTWIISTEGGIDFFEDDMPFKVGFYDDYVGNPHGRIKTDQLSETLSIPEPATLLLVGSGLAMLWLFGRRRFRTGR